MRSWSGGAAGLPLWLVNRALTKRSPPRLLSVFVWNCSIYEIHHHQPTRYIRGGRRLSAIAGRLNVVRVFLAYNKALLLWSTYLPASRRQLWHERPRQGVSADEFLFFDFVPWPPLINAWMFGDTSSSPTTTTSTYILQFRAATGREPQRMICIMQSPDSGESILLGSK